MADNVVRGHNPKKKFYMPVMVDNADGSIGEFVMSFSSSYYDMGTVGGAMEDALHDAREHGGKVYIYECIPIRIVTPTTEKWVEDDVRWAAQEAVLREKNK